MNKEYFMNRLANGENMDTIGAEVAAMMNAAVAEYNAKMEAEKKRIAAEAEKEAAKRELFEELVEIVQELAILEGFDPEELAISDEDIDDMIAAFSEMFNAMREVKKLVTSLEAVKGAEAPVKTPAKSKVSAIKTDDEVLADFVTMLGL